MAARSLGSLTVDLILKASGFAEGWTAAERDADKAQRKMTAKAKQSAKEVSDAWNGAAKLVGTTFAGISVGAVFSEMVGVAKQTAEAAAEVERFSQLANTSTKDFQRLAAGANTVGVSGEKLADIFKDVQDKVGDFIQTGGGGMADFFERVAPKVGVTAEQFRKLSGPDALQLYVSSLEKANLSQSDMIFFMEAIASDSSNLIPLLKDQGTAWQELGDKAEAYGAILSGDALEAAKAYKAESDNLGLAMKGLQNEISSGLLPSLTELNSNLASPEVQGGIRDTIGALADMASGVVNLGTEFFLGMQYADGFWDALVKFGFANPFKDAKTQMADLGEEIDKERERAERFSIFWTEAQILASAARIKDLEQQRAYFAEIDRLVSQRENRRIDSLSREGLPSYDSLGGLPEPVKLSAAFSKPAAKAGGGGKSQADKDREAAEKYVLALREQAEAVKSLSATEKLAYDLSEKKIKLTAKQTEQARTYAQAIEQQLARQKAAAEFEKEAARVTAESDRNEQLREEIELIGRNADQQYEVQRLRVEETLLIKQQHAAELDRLNTTDAGWSRQRALLESEIQLLEERLSLMDSGRARQKAADSWKVQQEQGEKAMDSIVQSFTDGLINGTQSFSQLLKNTVFTVAVRPAVEQGIRSALGMEQQGGAGGGLGGGNPFSDWSTWGTKAGDFLSDTGFRAIGEGFTDVGVGLNNLGSTIQGWDATIKGIPGLEGGFGSVFGYGQALMSLSEGNYGEAIGTAIGTYIMPGIGTFIGSTLGGLVDGMFGGGTPHAGAASQYAGGQITAGGKQFTRNAINADYTAGLQGSVDSLAFTLGSALDGLDKIFGGSGGFSVTTGFKADSDDPSNATLQISNAVGDTLVKWLAQRSGEFGSRATGQSYDSDPEKGFDEYLKAITAATIPQFKAIVPQWADAMLDSFGQSIGFSGNASDWESISVSGGEAMQALQQVAAQIAQVEQAFASLGETLPMFANISDDVKSALLGSLGGMEGFGAAANSFYENFYSEAERMARAADRIKQATGIDPRLGEQAKEQFRNTVEAALQGGNGALAAQMLSLSDAFATAADYAQQLRSEIETTAIATTGMSEWLREPLIALESQLSSGFDRKYLAEDTARGMKDLLSSVGVDSDLQDLANMMLTATSAEVETYFREVWNLLPTEEANLALVGLADTMLQLAQATDAAAAAAAQSTSTAWGNLGSVAGLAAQYTGNTAGLSSQLGTVQSSFAGATDTTGRVAALQQIVGLEQAIWNADEKSRQAEAQAAQSRSAAAQAQLATVQGLARAAQGLRDFVTGLRLGDLSGNSESKRLSLLADEYVKQLGAANAGNVDAFSDVQRTTTDYLNLFKQTASTEAELAAETGRITAELEAAATIAGAQASSQEQMLSHTASTASYAAQEFKVSEATQKLIDEMLLETMEGFEVEADHLSDLVKSGHATVDAIQSLPAEIAGIFQSVLVPAIAALAPPPFSDAIPQYAVGTPYVPHDQLAVVHEGEMIVPKRYNPNAGAVNSGAFAPIKEDARMQNAATLQVLNRILTLFRTWDGSGMPPPRDEEEVTA